MSYEEMRTGLERDLDALYGELEALYANQFCRLTDLEEDDRHDSWDDVQDVLARMVPLDNNPPAWFHALHAYVRRKMERSCFDFIRASLAIIRAPVQ